MLRLMMEVMKKLMTVVFLDILATGPNIGYPHGIGPIASIGPCCVTLSRLKAGAYCARCPCSQHVSLATFPNVTITILAPSFLHGPVNSFPLSPVITLPRLPMHVSTFP
jgi:hypothetical protein